MNFYEFGQNNSGGTFEVNDKLCHRVFIEAESAQSANAKLEELGGYFDGCSTERDCHCCGDRWYSVAEGDAIIFPKTCGCFEKERAKAIAATYKLEARKNKKAPQFGQKKRDWEVVFSSMDSYARWVADEYGWTSPDVRIYYANGAVLKIHSVKVDTQLKKKRKQ